MFVCFMSLRGQANQLSIDRRNGARRNCISTAIQGQAFGSARLLLTDDRRPSVDYLLPKIRNIIVRAFALSLMIHQLTIRFSILLLISRARVKKASSTFMLFFADVSRNLIPYSMASCSPR